MGKTDEGVLYICDQCGKALLVSKRTLGSLRGYSKEDGYTVTYQNKRAKMLFREQERWLCSTECLRDWAINQTENPED